MNFQTNDGQKVALTGFWESYETPAQSTDSHGAADNKVPALTVDLVNDQILSLEDMLQTHRMVSEISCETCIRLECYEVTTMSPVVAFY